MLVPSTSTFYQTKPVRTGGMLVWSSPTFSVESRDKWASAHVRMLGNLHDEHPPTHFVTIKLQRPESVENIKHFTKSLVDAVWYWNKKSSWMIAGRWTLEIERDNSCHLHILVRVNEDISSATYFTDCHDPKEWFSEKTEKINRKVGTTALLNYCEPVRTVEGATSYVYKLGRSDVLLFGKGLGLRQTGHFGNYFCGSTQTELRKQRREELQFQELERVASRTCESSTYVQQ